MNIENSYLRLIVSALTLLIWATFSLLLRIFQGLTASLSNVTLSLSFLEMFIIIICCILVLFKKYIFINFASIIFFIDTLEFAYNPVRSPIAVLIRLVLFIVSIGGVLGYFSYKKSIPNKHMRTSFDETFNNKATINNSLEQKTELEMYKEIDDSNLSEEDKTIIYGELLGLKGTIKKSEITKVWKKMLENYHPDKVSHLGKEFQIFAEKKTKDINKAYFYFKKKFGL